MASLGHPRHGRSGRIGSALVSGAVLLLVILITNTVWAKVDEAPQRLEMGGGAPAFYYPPEAPGGMHPVVVYLHGRGGNPEQDCIKWSRVAREVGWLLCPSGQEDRGPGVRGWGNNWIAGKAIVDRAVSELRKVAGRKVQLRGNTIVGFSEGAFVAMNIGVREPDVFNRWLILAANDSYWGGEGDLELAKNHSVLKRVYLLTGQQDGVVRASRKVFDLLDQAGIHVLLRTVPDLGHQIPAEKMRGLYRRPLRWLNAVR